MQREYIPISRRRVLEEMRKKKRVKINDCSIGEWLNKLFPDIKRATSRPRAKVRDPMKYGKYGKTTLEQISKWVKWLRQGDNIEQICIESGFTAKTVKARIKRAIKDKDIFVMDTGVLSAVGLK
jgi:hypothetical protein